MNYYIPIMLNGSDADLIVHFSEVYPKGKILGARILDQDHVNIQNRSLIELKATDYIEFVYEYDVYRSIGDYYEYDGWYILNELYVGNGLDFAWEPLEVGEYVYCFEIVDLYGESTFTDWLSYDYFKSATESGVVDDAIWDNFEDNIVQTSNTGIQDNQYVNYDMPWLYLGVQPPSEWAIPHINTAYNNNLMTPNTFDGFKSDISREVFCELVVNMYETITDKTIAISNPHIFSDTNNIEIVKAHQLGIVTGYGNGTFGPDDLITREQLMTMFYRALAKLDGDYMNYYYPQLQFGDTSSLSSWAREPARLLVYYELINGVGGNNLAPQDNATVEQSLKLVNGVYEFYVSYSLF